MVDWTKWLERAEAGGSILVCNLIHALMHGDMGWRYVACGTRQEHVMFQSGLIFCIKFSWEAWHAHSNYLWVYLSVNNFIIRWNLNIFQVRHYFEYEDPNGPVNEIWRQVSLKAPLIKLLTNRYKRLLERGTNGTDCSCICSTTPTDITAAS